MRKDKVIAQIKNYFTDYKNIKEEERGEWLKIDEEGYEVFDQFNQISLLADGKILIEITNEKDMIEQAKQEVINWEQNRLEEDPIFYAMKIYEERMTELINNYTVGEQN